MGQYDWRVSCGASINNNYSATQASVTVTAYWVNVGWSYQIGIWAQVGADGQTSSWSGGVDSTTVGYNSSLSVGSRTFYVNKGTSARNITCTAWIEDTSGNSYAGGYTRSGTTSVSVAALASYSISYNANGGSGAPGAQTKYYGNNITLSTTKPTRTGYTFQGWATSSTGSVAYNSGSTYSSNSSITLYAVWSRIGYTVSYNANGGTGAPGNQTKWHSETLTLSSTVPTRTNYKFLGWSTSSTATTANYSAGGSYTGNAALTLYAVWQLMVYNVTYNANSGDSNIPATQQKTHGTNLTLSSLVPIKNNTNYTLNVTLYDAVLYNVLQSTGQQVWTFKEWNTEPDGSGYSFSPGGIYTIEGHTTLYAQYTFVPYQMTSVTLPTLTKKSNTFLHWNTTQQDTGTSYNGGSSITPSTNITLYAIWNKTHVITSNVIITKQNEPYVYKIRLYVDGQWKWCQMMTYDGTGWIQGGKADVPYVPFLDANLQEVYDVNGEVILIPYEYD